MTVDNQNHVQYKDQIEHYKASLEFYRRRKTENTKMGWRMAFSSSRALKARGDPVFWIASLRSQ